MCAPSVERGGGENGWADGLTGGALRAGLEPPAKTSGEICCLEQFRPDAERPGPLCSGGPTLSWWGAVQWRTCSPPAGGCPRGVDCGGVRGYRRCWADPMAGLANAGTMGLTSRRGHGGRCGGGGGRSGAVAGVGSVARGCRRPGPGSTHPSGGPESHGETLCRPFPSPFLRMGGLMPLKRALRG